jgi:hypothetical protein
MATKRSRTLVLVLVLVALAGALLAQRQWGPPARTSAAPSTVQATRGAGGPAPKTTSSVADLKIDELSEPRPAPLGADRNPFRFRPKPPPPPPPTPPPTPNVQVPQVEPTGPTGPAPPPPIALKFIGVLDAPGKGKIAVLSDGGNVFHGHEGEIIDGRYRIVKIGVESIEMMYVDGRGRQTIRLTGS